MGKPGVIFEPESPPMDRHDRIALMAATMVGSYFGPRDFRRLVEHAIELDAVVQDILDDEE